MRINFNFVSNCIEIIEKNVPKDLIRLTAAITIAAVTILLVDKLSVNKMTRTINVKTSSEDELPAADIALAIFSSGSQPSAL